MTRRLTYPGQTITSRLDRQSQSVRLLLAICAMATVLAACQTPTLPKTTSAQPPLSSPVAATASPAMGPELPSPSTAPFPGLSWTFNGATVDSRFINLIDAPEQCGLPKVQLLTVGEPFGQEMHTDQDSLQFVRDPDHLVQDKSLDTFSASTELPSDTHFTGLKYDDLEVWAASDLPGALYIVRGDTVERWPRVTEFIACA